MNDNYANFQLRKFMVVSSQIEAIPLSKENKKAVLPDLDINVFFKIFHSSDDKKEFKVVATITGNPEKKLSGYAFVVQAESFFIFKKKIKKSESEQYLLFSGLPMVINSIRAFLMSVTAFGPYGQYTLPMLDVKKIIEKQEK